jgi:hypothetical protein
MQVVSFRKKLTAISGIKFRNLSDMMVKFIFCNLLKTLAFAYENKLFINHAIIFFSITFLSIEEKAGAQNPMGLINLKRT